MSSLDAPLWTALRKKVKVKLLSHVRLFATPWTVAYEAPLSMEFSRQECWSGLPCPSPKLLHLLQSCLTLCDPMYHSLPGYSVHGILQTRILEWVAVLSSQPRDQTLISYISCIEGRFLRTRLSTEELMLLNCGVGEDPWESLGLQGDQTSLS